MSQIHEYFIPLEGITSISSKLVVPSCSMVMSIRAKMENDRFYGIKRMRGASERCRVFKLLPVPVVCLMFRENGSYFLRLCFLAKLCGQQTLHFGQDTPEKSGALN